MTNTLAAVCENFIENRDTIKSALGWESAYLYPVCAAIFTDKGMRANREKLLYCRDVLKAKTGIFSNFRGYGKLAMISILATGSSPEDKLQKALAVYDALKGHFYSSPYLPVTSMILAELVEPEQYSEIAMRTRRIYNLMKKEHPFLTSGEDSVFAAMLAFSDMTDEEIVKETERCYRLLKPNFFSGNAVQSLSHVLALSGVVSEDKCQRTLNLYNALKKKGCRYGTDYELATLGILAMLPTDQSEVVNAMIEVDNFLAGKKGYGLFGIGRRQRLMHAGMLVHSAYAGETDGNMMSSAAIGSSISLIAAQQAAMCAAIAASTAAANSNAT